MQFGSKTGSSCGKILQVLSIEASLWYIFILGATTWIRETEKNEPAKSEEKMYLLLKNCMLSLTVAPGSDEIIHDTGTLYSGYPREVSVPPLTSYVSNFMDVYLLLLQTVIANVSSVLSGNTLLSGYFLAAPECKPTSLV
jgi:hypothetical protein